jgi:hypothetical protein
MSMALENIADGTGLTTGMSTNVSGSKPFVAFSASCAYGPRRDRCPASSPTTSATS